MSDIEEKIEKLISFLLAVPIFLSPFSPYLLADADVWDDSLAFPLVFFLTPVAVLIGVKNIGKLRGVRLILLFPLLCFFFWIQMLAVYSSQVSPISFVYAMQWSLLFFWGLYFLTGFGRNNLDVVVRVFFYGAFLGATYIFISGLLEVMLYGSLMDNGRMTQNLILKGQYQILVYVPTSIALSSVVSLLLYKVGVLKISWIVVFIYLVISFLAILFTGAREGFFMFVSGCFFVFFINRFSALVVPLFFSLLVIFLFYINSDLVFEKLAESEIRLFVKLAALSSSPLGGRDLAVTNYLNLYKENIFFGMAMLPPEISMSRMGVDSKSAHNFYVDALAWSGSIGFALLMMFFLLLLLYVFHQSVLSHSYRRLVLTKVFFVLLLVLFVSNNINVPLRQPLVVPLFMFVVYLSVSLFNDKGKVYLPRV